MSTTTEPTAITRELTGDERGEFLNDAHSLIDWLQANPGIPLARYSALHLHVYDSWVEAETDWDAETNQYKPITDRVFTPAKVAKAMRKADKNAGGSQFTLTRKFGAHGYTYSLNRADVCERKVTGQKEVRQMVPADDEAAVMIDELKSQIDSLHVERTTTEDVVEYVCPESLLSLEKQS